MVSRTNKAIIVIVVSRHSDFDAHPKTQSRKLSSWNLEGSYKCPPSFTSSLVTSSKQSCMSMNFIMPALVPSSKRNTAVSTLVLDILKAVNQIGYATNAEEATDY